MTAAAPRAVPCRAQPGTSWGESWQVRRSGVVSAEPTGPVCELAQRARPRRIGAAGAGFGTRAAAGLRVRNVVSGEPHDDVRHLRHSADDRLPVLAVLVAMTGASLRAVDIGSTSVHVGSHH